MRRVSAVSIRYIVPVTAIVSMLAIAACESASTSVTTPSGSKCATTVKNNTSELPAAGGNGTITVTTSRDCQWSASTDASWITLGTTSGQGAATVTYTAGANPRGTGRHAGIVVADQTLDVAQAAAECRFDVSPSTVTVDSAGHQVTVNIATLDGCTWTARPSASWISRLSPTAGTGNASVQLTIDGNASADARAGTVVIGNTTVRIAQSGTTPEPGPPTPAPPGPSCSFTVSPSDVSVAAGGDQITIGVTAAAGCAWSAATSAPWITIVAGAAGSGDGSVKATVAANSGGARSATLTVAGRPVTISQAAAAAPPPPPPPPSPPPCTYTIKPTWYDAGRGPDTITVNVTTDASCSWTTSTTADWVRIDTGSTGTVNGIVRLVIPANDGPERSTTVTIAGNAFALHQDAGCMMSIKPDYYDAGRGPDDIRIAVTAGPGCTWTATSPVSWVTVAEGSTGTGNGTVRLLVQPNDGPARAATLTIASRPFALTQESGQ